MKIQYASDLHLEFSENTDYIKRNPLQVKGDILILAGDIILLCELPQYAWFFDFCSKNFKFTYWLCGNHEYYHYDLALKCGTFNEKIRKNVFLVNNVSVKLDGVKLMFSTLWGKINPQNEFLIEQAMNDFKVIKYKGYRFSAPVFTKLHGEALDFLVHEIAAPFSGKKIVVTHNAPTFMNYPEKYKGGTLSEAFAVELFDLIDCSDVDYWIYGHHHVNTPDFEIGQTKLITNQLGYVKYGLDETFDNGKIITVNA